MPQKRISGADYGTKEFAVSVRTEFQFALLTIRTRRARSATRLNFCILVIDSYYLGTIQHMNKRQELDLMDKVQRELEDLKNSQTSVLKKVSQIAAHNITLGVDLLDNKLPDLEEQVNATLKATSDLSDVFAEYRANFFSDNNLAATVDPTA